MTIPARLLIIAGSDCSGGAGIQADIKSATAFGVFAMTAITAITVQNTTGVTAVQAITPENVYGQIKVCIEDIGVDAIKTGMLVDAPIIEAVADALTDCAADVPLILDPVMVATSGAALIDDAAVDTLIHRLLPRATLITPNLPEAKRLTGIDADSKDGARAVAAALQKMGAKAVLIKGGHRDGGVIADLLIGPDGQQTFSYPRLDTRHTHGTGCTLASAIASSVARGVPLTLAVEKARAYVQRAIENAPGFGVGHGPLNHMVAAD
ncbi:MAG: bifunctional hydroxymethylpyrimidine kinase/phosphomethylpyrimidine kinase [Rhizomicrobium sp.]